MPLHLNSGKHADERSAEGLSAGALKLTRRCFLALCLAGCAHGTRPPAFRRHGEIWGLLSDTHISADLEAEVRGACMARNLRSVIADVVAAAPDRVLVNGDVAFARGERADYSAFQDLISPLRRIGTPLHITLGNHDDRKRLVEALAVPHDQAIADKVVSDLFAGDMQWLLLDSLETVNGIRGSLGPTQRAWLTRELEASARVPTVVCVHHNPERSLVGLRDFEEFLQIVVPRRQVKLVLFGHTHENRVWQQDGLHFVNLPAVGYRFQPNTSLGWLLARTQTDGARLEFRGVNAGEPPHGESRELIWRSDA